MQRSACIPRSKCSDYGVSFTYLFKYCRTCSLSAGSFTCQRFPIIPWQRHFYMVLHCSMLLMDLFQLCLIYFRCNCLRCFSLTNLGGACEHKLLRLDVLILLLSDFKDNVLLRRSDRMYSFNTYSIISIIDVSEYQCTKTSRFQYMNHDESSLTIIITQITSAVIPSSELVLSSALVNSY
jgi:hypothetical protein